MDGLAELLATNRTVQAIGLALGLLSAFSIAFFTVGPGLLQRFETWRSSDQGASSSAHGRTRWLRMIAERPRPVVIWLIVGSSAFASGYFWRSFGWYTPLIVGTLAAALLSGSLAALEEFRWSSGAMKPSPSAQWNWDLVVAEPQPLPKQEPPRPEDGPRVQSLPGTLSHVRRRVHADAGVSRKQVSLLRKHRLEVTTSRDVGLLETVDRAQLDRVIANRAVIITHDRNFLDFHHDGGMHAGIIYAPRHPVFRHEVLRICLRLAAEISEV